MIALLYLVEIGVAELMTAIISPTGGIVVHTIILFSLIMYSVLEATPPFDKLYLSLTLAPLIRIVSLAMPVSRFGEVYSFGIICVPILVATIAAIRYFRFYPADIGLSRRNVPLQVAIGLFGIVLGIAEYAILKPDAETAPALTEIIASAIILIVATGFVEELAFRGVIQRCAKEAFGAWGWVYVAGVFSLLHLGHLSVMHLMFVLTMALSFGWIVDRTGSLWGVTFAHGIANVCLYLVIPTVV
ncbi:MAG: CPBP family intramembrane glutamic endopeptidase [Chloroflexota bacterium]|nr:CPBP family intramembrane glutamic endopeptidase [Chloroflexota bacterium]